MPHTHTKPAVKPEHVQRLERALREDFRKVGSTIKVRTERIKGTKLHRITVVSPRFKRKWFSQKNEIVWRVARKVLSDDEQLAITTIYTFTPDEARGIVA